MGFYLFAYTDLAYTDLAYTDLALQSCFTKSSRNQQKLKSNVVDPNQFISHLLTQIRILPKLENLLNQHISTKIHIENLLEKTLKQFVLTFFKAGLYFLYDDNF